MLTAYPRNLTIPVRDTMATFADFYLWPADEPPEWLGSLSLDGYPSGIPLRLRRAANAADFKTLVTQFLLRRDDGILASDSWPGPQPQVRDQGYVYAWHPQGLLVADMGRGWLTFDEALADKRRLRSLPHVSFPVVTPIKRTLA